MAASALRKLRIRLYEYSGYFYYKAFKSAAAFTFKGNRCRYFYHLYNTTWLNERAIEVPIVMEYLKKYDGKKILEAGNVLSHYLSFDHDIVDKYEKAPGVINADVVSFSPQGKYDLIVSISTLEHVGWDEIPREPSKIILAVENLKGLLASGGEMIVTLPLGYNCDMDIFLKEKRLIFDEAYYYRRISKDNRWIEADPNNLSGIEYDAPYPAANALFIGIIKGR